MVNRMKHSIFKFLCLIMILIIYLNPLQLKKAQAIDIEESSLIRKISKDYTKKFCNSIGFGLSKESAMKFAYKENKQIFSKKKGFKNINKEILIDEISNSVIETCGYSIGITGNEGIEYFKEFYTVENEQN